MDVIGGIELDMIAMKVVMVSSSGSSSSSSSLIGTVFNNCIQFTRKKL